ncbi:hypothetical protein ACHAXT_001837 [Thalassiosira profunda]
MSASPPETIDCKSCNGSVMAADPPAPPITAPADDAAKEHKTASGIRKYLTLSNLFYVYMLYEMLPFGGKKADDAGRTTMSTKMPTVQQQQHFLWEPVGYAPTVAISAPPVAPTSKQQGSGARSVYRGYYSKDKLALAAALRSIPFQPTLGAMHDATTVDSSGNLCQSGTNATPTGSLGTEEFDDEPVVCSEESIATSEASVPKATFRSALSSSVIVLDLSLNGNPTKEIAWVRSAVAFLLGTVRESRGGRLEVLVKLESNGGSVHHYGLLAEQFRRLRQEPNVTLTVACDLACLSGGYLAAAVASPGQLLASPFAAVGSIGVVSGSNSLDLREALEAHGIREVRVQSGARKPAVGLLGGMTDDELRYAQERSDATHRVFRDHVQRWRGDAVRDIDFVASGDHWLGVDALDHGLVDRLATSDEYIDGKIGEGFSVVRMKEHASKKTGLLGGDAGGKSWFWTIFDWLFPVEATGDQQAFVGRVDPSLSLALRLLRDYLSELE